MQKRCAASALLNGRDDVSCDRADDAVDLCGVLSEVVPAFRLEADPLVCTRERSEASGIEGRVWHVFCGQHDLQREMTLSAPKGI